MRIVLDPGHGGPEPDSYRQTSNGVREAEWNLKVALDLRKKVQNLGVEVVLTRDEDRFVDLDQRVFLGQNSDLFISIHHNRYDDDLDSYSSFPLVYIHGGINLDLGLGLLAEFERVHPRKGGCLDDRLVFESGIRVCAAAHCPAVLGEFDFFVSRDAQERKNFFEDEVQAYFAFIESFLNKKLKKPSLISDQDIQKMEELYLSYQLPPWLVAIQSKQKSEFLKLKGQDRLAPLVGRIFDEMENYYA